ncbi:uncharacterized protein K441DRAFT_669625 [Cenococcum geophilum 1.58]|uniref:Uncharacterized protein n=1 Tax=Cenococcum geophilum 1.58 TaxID=794803 RepID=A0ACC8EPD8_9PEZI|nr:hypothetical protein K441DRAFT_669625 [Cenococcum geophilum 1.58]
MASEPLRAAEDGHGLGGGPSAAGGGCYVALADEEVREDGAGRRALAARELDPGC